LAGEALQCAQRFLRRWSDATTLRERDDLAQDAALQAWRHADDVREWQRFPAMVRTISRRVRARVLLARRRFEALVVQLDYGLEARLSAPSLGHCLCVAGEAIDVDWLAEELVRALAELRPADRDLLLAFYSGTSCAELAVRHQLPRQRVKVRLHRGRRRLRRTIEERARVAGLLD
jgi:RNA polymerase sigma factor (sigma-70 family)